MPISQTALQTLIDEMTCAKKMERSVQTRLARSKYRVERGLAKGTQEDFFYAKAGKIVYNTTTRTPKKGTTLYVDVVFEGILYEKVEVSWKPLDRDKNKSTVMVQKSNKQWTMLWFWDKDIRAG